MLALVVTLLLWASAFPAIRAALEGYGPGHLALARFVVASVVLAVLAPFARVGRPPRSAWPHVIAAALTGFTLYHLALNRGEMTVPAGTASVIANTVPLFTAVLAMLFLGERLTPAFALGGAFAFAGVAIIARGDVGGLSPGTGTLFVLLASVGQATYFVILKAVLGRYRAMEMTCWGVWTGTAFLLVAAPGLGEAVARAPAHATAAVVYLGVFPGALAYFAWAFVLSRLPAGRASATLFLVPVLATSIAWVWLRETPVLTDLAGGALVLGGVAIGMRLRRRPGFRAFGPNTKPPKM